VQPPPRPRPLPPRLSRRALLAGSGVAGLAAFLAACGQSPASVPPSPTPSGRPTTRPGSTGAPGTPGQSPSTEPAASGTPEPTATPVVSLERMVAGLVVVGFRGATLDPAGWVASSLAGGLGGVILFDRDQQTGTDRNIRSPARLRRLTSDLRAAAGGTPVIAVDQEGGIVTRLSPAHGFPAVASEASVGRGSAAHARRWASGLASTLADAGITLNLAPVVDLDVNPTSPAIGALDRSFSPDADVVVAMAEIEVEAHRRAGVATALKHFPGIGSSTGNTDNGVVDVTRSWHRAELEPFRRLIASDHADLVMVGHVRNDRLDPDAPASLSRAVVTDLLRGTLGWAGVVITDDLQAGAVAAEGASRAAIRALQAGVDLLLFANQQVYDEGVADDVIAAVADGVTAGDLDRAEIEASWARVDALFPRS
jgi:beta-N-acetylhexosaminidase